jgi:transglutaminase-like putative cysteine protease
MLALVAAMAMSPAAAMRWADWVPGLWVLQAISLLAVAAGFFCGRSRFSAGVALLLCLIYGLFAVGLFSGLLLPRGLPWHEKIPELLGRQAFWMVKAANVVLNPDAADVSRDWLIFVMQTGMLLWLLGFAAAWYTYRQLRIWRAVLPSGVLLLATEVNYHGPEPLGTVLVAYLLLALLYIVGSHYSARERGWIRARVVFSTGTGLEFLQAGLLMAVLATPIAWLAPNLSAERLAEEQVRPIDAAWQRVQDGWGQLFASLKSYGGDYSDPHGGTVALGGPRQVAPRAIMDVKAEGGWYWRGAIYDTYTGEGWTSTADTRLIVFPDRPLATPRYTQRQPITATITNYLPDTGVVYFPHQPARTDRQAKFEVFDSGSDSHDISKILSRYLIYEGNSYRAWGSASVADADALRLAGTSYPRWVRERYLQLPSGFSPRVTQLADSIVGPSAAPYDKAEALTSWLRDNIVYDDSVEAPPVDVDPLEYLLFRSMKGYCSYYASALAVMLRGQGVPARFVAGYAQGVWNEDLGAYRVRGSDAHNWVEVFFPSYGWVEFEPTASQPAIVRTAVPQEEPAPPEDTGREQDLEGAGPDSLARERLERLLREDEEAGPTGLAALRRPGTIAVVALLSVVLAAAAGILFVERHKVRGLSVVTQVYRRMNRLGGWLQVRLLPSQTPHERAAALIVAAPKAAAPIDVITDLYVEERFGLASTGEFDEQATRAWHELWPTVLQESALRYLARFQRDGSESGRRRRA